MVFEVQQGRQCAELVKFQANEIQKGIDAEVALREESKGKTNVIVSLTQEKSLAKADAKNSNELLDNQKDITHHEKVQKRKWKFATFVAVSVIVLREVFSSN